MELSPIRNLIPTEKGGRIARKGFVYQDHVAAHFIIEILTGKEISEIWIEGEDDIVLLWPIGGDVVVEMIQIKSNDLESRWSISKLMSLELLPKSLARGRCKENVCYRIVTSTDIDSELSFMKVAVNDSLRDNTSVDKILNDHFDKFSSVLANSKGQTVEDWFKNCFWEVFPAQLESLKAQNLVKLERCILENYDLVLPPDQRLEIYQKILAFVSNAGVGEEKCGFSKEEIIVWFDNILKDLAAPKLGSEKLIEKLEAAKVANDTQKTAREFRWMYQKESLNFNFYGRNQINGFKDKVHTLIQTLKIQYDNGSLNFNDSEFHKFCWDKVQNLAREHGINEEIALGCMYDNTNRCTHRFTKATS